jgi:hypothetical protein
MNYSVVCKDKDDFNAKLNKYIKIELLNNNKITEKEKILLIQHICEHISVNYCFRYVKKINDDKVKTYLDIFKFIYLYFTCSKDNISDNIAYMPLFPISKYNWIYSQFELLQKEDKVIDINLLFRLDYTENNISDFNKKRFGNYRISLVDNIPDKKSIDDLPVAKRQK